MNKKMLATLLSVSMVAGALSGCAGNANEEESTKSESKKDKGGAVELSVWCAEEDNALMNDIINSFKSKYSDTTFDIKIDFMPESDCKNSLLKGLEDGPDVFSFADDQLRTLVAAGALSPVTNADDVKNRNLDSAVETAIVNSKLYAYPMTADNGYFLYYNKKYVSDEAAKSFDGIMKAAADNNKTMLMDWSSGWYLYSFFGQTGLEMGLNDDGISNYCTWNSVDNSIKGIDVLNAMLAIANNPGFKSGGDDAVKEGAANDTIVACVSGVWLSTDLQKLWGDNLGAAKLPTYTVNNKQVQMGSFSGFKMVGVNDYSDQKEWAHKLADWITNEENQTLRFQQRGQGPSNKNAAASGEVSKSAAIKALLTQSEFATPQRVGGNYWSNAQLLGETLASGSVGNKDKQEFLDAIVDGITLSYSN